MLRCSEAAPDHDTCDASSSGPGINVGEPSVLPGSAHLLTAAESNPKGSQLLPILIGLLRDLATLLRLATLPRAALLTHTLTAEKQSAMFLERGLKPRRATPAEKLSLVLLARFHNWRDSLVVVKPATFTKWMRDYTLRHWREICRRKAPGRPRIPNALRALVRSIAAENPI